MSDGSAALRRQIDNATDLQAVVRTMKAIAAAGIGQFEQSVRALADYERTVALGLGASLRALGPATVRAHAHQPAVLDAVVFGSDQGLVGRFNEVVAELAAAELARLPVKPRVWAVGERLQGRLADVGLSPRGTWAVPRSVHGIAPLVAQILLNSQPQGDPDTGAGLLLFYNAPAPGARHAPVSLRLLPLDEAWRQAHAQRVWPTPRPPQVVGGGRSTLAALVGEYLFVSLFRACALSLASENASRLAAMERADQNIEGLLETLQGDFHRQRQNRIDEELFDVIAGFEALGGSAAS